MPVRQLPVVEDVQRVTPKLSVTAQIVVTTGGNEGTGTKGDELVDANLIP